MKQFEVNLKIYIPGSKTMTKSIRVEAGNKKIAYSRGVIEARAEISDPNSYIELVGINVINQEGNDG